MNIIRKNIITICVVCCILIFLIYKHVFIRSSTVVWPTFSNIIWTYVNPLPYEEYFYIRQKKPSTFFTTPAFPTYTKWCHDNKKLCSILPLQQLYADTQWIWSIQFIWSQESPNQYLWLSKLLDNLSNLAPYWDYPYAFWQLLIPLTKKQTISEWTWIAEQSWRDAKVLADRWEYYLCKQDLIEQISSLNEETFIDTYYNENAKKALSNPCPTYERAHYAAFNAFYYRKNAEESAKNYKISSFTQWSPWLAPIMAALVYGRWGEHIKSASIWYDKYISLAEKVSNDPEASDIIKNETNESLKKAVFELQLQLITDADDASKQSCKKSYECLQKNWHIKNAIEKSYNTICQKWQVDTNLRCVLLYIWLTNKRISLDGKMIYPLVPEIFDFAWSNVYNSWWIEWKKDTE